MGEDEDWGLSKSAVLRMVEGAGFRLTAHRRFMWGLNNLYVAEATGVERASKPPFRPQARV